MDAQEGDIVDEIITDHHEVEDMLENGTARRPREACGARHHHAGTPLSARRAVPVFDRSRVLPNGDTITDREIREHAEAEAGRVTQ